MPVKIPTVQTGLEASIQAAAKKAGRNLKINMGGNAKSIEGLSQPLGRITGKADQFTKSMEAANARVLAFGASVGILASVTRGFKELVLTTIEVEKSLVSINSILGGSKKELEAFSKTIFDVARSTEQSFAAVSTAALELTRQGLTAVEVQKRLSDSLILSRLSGLGATEAVSGLTAAINSFNRAGLESGQVLNKLSAAAVSAAVSERDLIEGIKRAGSVANLAGVSFDELVGVITAVQVKTARGGAVIGNSFKTIFTRIQSIDKLETMQSLGVQVTDTSGKVLGATKLIQNLSKVLGELPEAKRLQIAEGLVGKFQIAPFLAILDDYNSKTSKAIAITEVSRQATSEAYDRNIALNQTLSTAINQATISLKELGDTLGKIGVTDNLKNLLGFFDTLVQSVKGKLDGEGAGGDFAKGIVKGIGAVISGPGLAIFGAIILKLGFDLAKFGIGSLKTFFGLNQAAREQATLQGQIASTLLGNKSIQETILSIENSSLSAEKKKVEQTKFFTAAIKEQLKVMKKMQGIAMKVTPGVRDATKRSRAAGGFIPNYNAIAGYGSESSDISKGVGGAPTSAKPVTIPNFNFGGGQKGSMVANSSEYIVPNYAGSGGSAIFNQDMVSSMGMPAGARKISAASGYIPNFAKEKGVINSKGKYVMLHGEVGGEDPQKMAYYHPEQDKYNVTDKEGAVPIRVPLYGLNDKNEENTVNKYIKTLEDYSIEQGIKQSNKLTGNKMPRPLHRDAIKAQVNSGAVAGFAGSIYELALATMLTDKEFDNYADQTENSNFDLKLKGQDKLLGLFNIKTQPSHGEVKGLSNANNVASSAAKIHRVMGREEFGKKRQDAQVSKIKGKKLTKPDALKYLGITKTSNKNYHVITEEDRAKFIKQIPEKQRPRFNNEGMFDKFVDKKNAAGGYIPNFANPLEDAVGREQAAGLPINQIRVNQSPKLRNAGNPMGLAVTNTRDEPTGAIPNFAQPSNLGLADIGTKSKLVGASLGKLNSLIDSLNGQIEKGTITRGDAEKEVQKQTKTIKTNGQVRGKINTAAKERLSVEAETTKGSRDMLGGIFATQIAFSALAGATSDAEDGFGRVANRLTTMGSSITTAVFAGSAISDFGESIQGLGGKFVEKLGTIGTAIGIGAAVFEGLTKIYEDATGITDTNNLALAKLADAADKAAIKLSDIGAVGKAEIEEQRNTILENVFNRREDGAKMGQQTLSDISISKTLLGRLAEVIDESLASGIAPDRIESTMRKEAEGGETRQERITRPSRLKGGGTVASKEDVTFLDQGEFNKVVDQMLKLKSGTQDVSEVFKDLSKEQLQSIVSFSKTNKLIDDGTLVLGKLWSREELTASPTISGLRKGMAATGMTGRKAQDRSLEQEAEKAPAKLKTIEKKEADDVLKGKRIVASLEKQRIQLAVDLAKIDRTALDQMDQKILKAELSKSHTEGEMIALKTEQSILNANFNLRNNTLDAVANMAKLSKELTFKEKASQELQDLIAESAKKTNFTVEEREILISKINKLLEDSDKSIQDGLRKELNSVSAAEKKTGQLIEQETVLGRIKVKASEIANIRATTDLDFIGQAEERNFDVVRGRKNAITARGQARASRETGEFSIKQSEDLRIQAAQDALLDAKDTSLNEKDDLNLKIDTQIKNRLNALGADSISALVAQTNTQGQSVSNVFDNLGGSDPALQKAIEIQRGKDTEEGLKIAQGLENFRESLERSRIDLDDQAAAALANAEANLKAAGFFEKISSQLSDDMALQLRRGAIQGKFDTDRISDPIARLKAQISEDSREARANAAQDPAETRRILRSDEAKFRDIDDKMTIDPVERIKNRINEKSRADRDAALDNENFEEFRRLVEEDQFSGKLIDASAQFAQNIGDAMVQAIAQGESLSDLLLGAASGFFNTLSQAFMQKAVGNIMSGFNAGGKVRGGSGNRDDVPALLTGGEFVMKKSSVNKYGSSFMASLNAGEIPAMARGGLFTPGTYGQEEIKGKSNLLDFATQSHTTGAFDKFRSGSGFASVNLEPQSAALTMFGRRNSPAFQREQASKEEAFSLFTQQANKDKELKEQKKQATKGLLGSIASSLFAFGFSSLTDKFSKNATGGAIPNAAGVDTVPSMLSGGEFVMNAAATQKIGRGNLNALNSGAGGGSGDVVSKLDELISVSDNTGETVINITVNSDGSSDSQGNGDDQQKSLATKIKDVVKQVIDDEKRLGGSLRQSRA